MSSRTIFYVLNIVGGLAVLGSYAWGIGLYPELREAFWGGVPESLRGLYTMNMFFAAAGYIATFAFFLSHRHRSQFGELYWCYLLVLLPSALWLPLTVAVLQHPSELLWRFIRVDLLAVALGAVLMLKHVLKTENSSKIARGLTAFGLLFFILQTLVLDGFVWPAYFELPTN